MHRILIVEDDRLIAELERDYLEAAGCETEIVLDGVSGLKFCREKEYDLVILDVMLPGISGFEICREIRKSKDLPVILVTAKKEDVDKIRGLGLGADDYVVKPFSPAELTARVKAHITIHERLLKNGPKPATTAGIIAARGRRIAPQARRVSVYGREISLTNKEFELLLFLAENPDIVFSRETLFDRVWGMDAAGDTATVSVHVNRLREKIEKDTGSPQFIETVWGVGYRFRL